MIENNITQTIARKRFKGHYFYKVIDLFDGELVNVRAVRQTGDKFKYALQLSPAEIEFMENNALVELEKTGSYYNVLEAIKIYDANVEKNIRQILKATSFIDESSIEVRNIAGHIYVLTRTEDKKGVPAINYLYGDESGRIHYNGPLPNDSAIHGLIQLSLIERPYDFNEKYQDEQVYQIGMHDYGLIAEYQDVFVTVPIILQEEQDGSPSWTTNADFMRFIEKGEDGVPKFIEKPKDVFPTLNDAQAFLGDKTKGLTERVILNI